MQIRTDTYTYAYSYTSTYAYAHKCGKAVGEIRLGKAFGGNSICFTHVSLASAPLCVFNGN